MRGDKILMVFEINNPNAVIQQLEHLCCSFLIMPLTNTLSSQGVTCMLRTMWFQISCSQW